MKSFLVALLFVGFVAAQLDETSFLLRHKRSAAECTEDDKQKNCVDQVKACCSDTKKCACDCSSLMYKESPEKSYEDFIKYANDQIVRSYEYLFLSAQFGTYLKDRPGFEKILHGLADAAWGKGIEMIQEEAKRGITHSFVSVTPGVKVDGDVDEIKALAKAVEIEKGFLLEANRIHRHHSHATLDDKKAGDHGYDAGISHYLEEEIIEGKTSTVRNLVGHVNDLKNLLSNGEKSGLFPMSLYLFDQYLQK